MFFICAPELLNVFKYYRWNRIAEYAVIDKNIKAIMNYMIEAQNEKHGDKSENIQTLYTPVKNANSRKSN